MVPGSGLFLVPRGYSFLIPVGSLFLVPGILLFLVARSWWLMVSCLLLVDSIRLIPDLRFLPMCSVGVQRLILLLGEQRYILCDCVVFEQQFTMLTMRPSAFVSESVSAKWQ